MELTKQTLTILKNFATINSGLCFEAGKTVKTITELTSTILAKATLDTTIDTEFCLGDLPKFLNVVSLVDAPKLDITNKRVIINSGKVRIRHVCADKDLIRCPPEKDITFPPVFVKFMLTNDMLKDLMKAASVLKMSEIAIIGDGEILNIRSINLDGKSQDYYNLEIGETNKTCSIIMSVENLKLIPGDYSVSFGHKNGQGLSRFKGIDFPVEYFIAVNVKSTYE